jgi:asparagine synthase (glutamine-hydrolysing)
LLDEPIADMSFLPLHLLARAARGSVTVALTGDGGDELFAGYPSMGARAWHDGFARLFPPARATLRRLAEAVPSLPPPLRRFLEVLDYSPAARNQALVGGLPPHQHPALLSAPMRAALAGFAPYHEIDRLLEGAGAPDRGARMIYQYCKLYLAGQNLANADRASMAASLELRAPFLDHTFVEFMGRVPTALKLRGLGRLKRLLKRAVADRLPPEIVARPKQGFGVPLGAWFRDGLSAPLREILAPERVAAGGVLDARAVTRLVDEHLARVRDHRRLLWALVVFESWRAHHLGERSAC